MADDQKTTAARTTLHTRLKLLLEWHRSAAVQMAAKNDTARKERHDGFEATVREAIGKLDKREKAVPGHLPTKEEVLLYADEIRLPRREADKFFDHFEGNGWKQGGKTPMKKWMATMRNWKRRWEEANPTAAKAMHVSTPTVRAVGDPPRWPDFLKLRSMEYHAYSLARGWIKTEFSEWIKTNAKSTQQIDTTE